MPGISGIISRAGSNNMQDEMDVMVESMMNESFYRAKTYSNPEHGVYIGWVNHKEAFRDYLPITNPTRQIILFFAGEIFGPNWQCKGNKRVCAGYNEKRLIGVLEEFEEKTLEGLNGWFSGLLLDMRQSRVLLFNDRYGMHRIFIHEGKKGFYFSSEAKSLLAILPEVRRYDAKGVGEFITCGCTLGEHSLYKGIKVFPSGALWDFEHGELKRKRSYFDVREWLDQRQLEEREVTAHVVESFGGIIGKYSEDLLPVGVSLTGGLDSRMVMACLGDIPREFQCYTFGSMYRETYDVKIAREVAKACARQFHVLVLGEEFLCDFSNYLEKAVYKSDGYIGLSGAAELYINSLARNLALVRLTGNYGGELLRGVCAFKDQVPQNELLNPEFMPYLREARKSFQRLKTKDAVTFSLFHQAPSQGYGRLAIERSQIVLRTPFMDNDLVKLVYQAPPRLIKNEDISVAIVSRYNPSLLRFPTDRGFLGGSPRLRRIISRLYREALFKGEYFVGHGMPNWLAATSCFGLSEILERIFLGRHKFQHFRKWTQKYFGEYIADVLLQGGSDLKEVFSKRHIEHIVRAHLGGTRNYTDEIDKVITLALGYRTLMKSAAFRHGGEQKFFSSG